MSNPKSFIPSYLSLRPYPLFLGVVGGLLGAYAATVSSKLYDLLKLYIVQKRSWKGDDDDFKMVLVVNPRAKKADLYSKCIEATCKAYALGLKWAPKKTKTWKTYSEGKVVLKVKVEDELEILYVKARSNGIIVYRAETEDGKIVALAIGPDYISAVNKITGHLKLL